MPLRTLALRALPRGRPPVRRGRRGDGPRPRGLRPLAAALAAGLAHAPAGAQRLELGGPPAPAPGAAWVQALADSAAAEAPAPDHDAPRLAASALRSAGARLLAAADAEGPAGSRRFVAAMTLLRAGEEVAAMSPEDLSPDAARSVAAASRRPLPGDAALDAHLRAMLAPVVECLGPPDGPCGWVVFPPRPPPALAPDAPDPWRSAPISEGARAAVAAFRAELRRSLLAPAQGDTAQSWTALLNDAGALASADPATVPQAARAAVGATAEAAAAALADLGPLDDPPVELLRLAGVARLRARVAPIEPARARESAQGALWRFLTQPPDASAERACLDAFSRALDRCTLPADPRGERSVVRQLRPAWRVLRRRAEDAARRAATRLPALLDDPAEASSPAAVAESDALLLAREDLDLLVALSAWLEGRDQAAPDPAAREARAHESRRRAAEACLPLAQRLARPADTEAALTEFRALARAAADLGALAGESALAAAAAGDTSPESRAWRQLAGDRPRALLDAIRTAREAWEAGVASRGAAADSTRLSALADAMHTLTGAAALLAAAGGEAPFRGALNAWPGWELSPAAAAALASRAAPLASTLAAACLSPDAERIRRAAAAYREGAAAGAAVAALERAARGAGLAEGVPAALELGAGPPFGPDCLLAAVRDDAAALCRYLEEEAREEDDQRRRSLEAYTRWVAARLLASLEPGASVLGP